MVLKLALCVLLSFVLLAHGLPDEVYRSEFSSWMSRHQKSYSPSEIAARFTAFKSNYDFIQTHNAGHHSFTVGLNAVSDLTVEEFAAKYLTLKTPSFPGKYVTPMPQRSGTSRQVEAPVHQHAARTEQTTSEPTTIDWEALGAVTTIKNQEQCGCCWAFAATAAIEAINQINGAPLTNFSNQQVLDCTGSDSSCNGGNFAEAMNGVASSGIQDMTTYNAYSAAQGSCQYQASLKAGSVRAVSYPLSNSEPGLAAQLQVQPITISFDASGQAFQNYQSGVYSSSTCSSTATNHAMLLIGYGVDSSSGIQYWRIKNQWGTYWGEEGYLRVVRGSNMCGVASYSAYPTLEVPPTTFYVFNNSFVNGWSLSTTGSVSQTNEVATSEGQELSASVAPAGTLVISLPQGSLTYRYFYYSIQASVASQVEIIIYFNGGAYTWTWFNMDPNSLYSSSLDLSAPQSASQILFNNTGTSTATWYLNDLYFQ